MKLRQTIVWLIAAVALSINVWEYLSYSDGVYRNGGWTTINLVPILEVGRAIFYASVLVLLERILAAARKVG